MWARFALPLLTASRGLDAKSTFKKDLKMLKKLVKMSSVRRVHHSSGISGEVLNFLFFICPRMKEPGIVVKNGVLTAQYVPGLSGFARARIAKVQGFLGEMKEAGFEYTATAIFATADAFILFSTPVEPPSETPLIHGMGVVSNYDIYLGQKDSFEEMLRRRPWIRSWPMRKSRP